MPEALHRATDATLHTWIAAWAVSAVMGGVMVTTGWRY